MAVVFTRDVREINYYEQKYARNTVISREKAREMWEKNPRKTHMPDHEV